MVVEVVAGILADSLALLSDAAHMLTDAGAIARGALRRRAGRAAGRGALHLRPRPRRDPLGPGQRRDAARAGRRHRRRGDPAPVAAPDVDGGFVLVVGLSARARTSPRRAALGKAERRSLERRGRPRARAHRPLRVAGGRGRGRGRAVTRLRSRRRHRLAAGGRGHAALGLAAAARRRPRAARGRARGHRPEAIGHALAAMPGRRRGPRPARLGGHLGLPGAGRARARRAGRRLPRRAPLAAGAWSASASASST